MKTKLIPPDKKRCQRQFVSGCWPDAAHFMIIGPRELIRCKNKPAYIIKERKPGRDGKKGSMSLCACCFTTFIREFGLHFADIKKLKNT